jgi:uncharacterized protein (TIGR02646 family)
MKRVKKSEAEPVALLAYKQRFASAPNQLTWNNFKKQTNRREQVKAQLREDQRGLCAYCENTLIPEDESVEHFEPRDANHNRELDWSNLLLCCAGGERPLPEEVADGSVRYDADGPRTCGHAKANSQDAILNPLNLPNTPRLFKYKSETGEIVPDADQCAKMGMNIDLCERTIAALGLRARRLNAARLALMNELLRQLGEAGSTGPFSMQRERELAAIYFAPTGSLPPFFTVLRFSLGGGAEEHLQTIGFQG